MLTPCTEQTAIKNNKQNLLMHRMKDLNFRKGLCVQSINQILLWFQYPLTKPHLEDSELSGGAC